MQPGTLYRAADKRVWAVLCRLGATTLVVPLVAGPARLAGDVPLGSAWAIRTRSAQAGQPSIARIGILPPHILAAAQQAAARAIMEGVVIARYAPRASHARAS